MKRTDKQIVEGLINNDPDVISSFFYEDFSSTLDYILKCVFDYRADKDELVNELYIYLSDKDWHKVKQFDFRSKLTTWLSVVAIRFFQKKRDILIDNASIDAQNIEKLNGDKTWIDENKIDIEHALAKLKNERYRQVVLALDILDRDPKEVAEELNTKVSNLYNIRRRAHLCLKSLLI